MTNKQCKKKGCRKNGSYYEGLCRDHYKKGLSEYSKGKVIKQFAKQKLYELGIIPTGLASIIFIPYSLGIILLEKIIKIDWMQFCIDNQRMVTDAAICTAERDIFYTWTIGLCLIAVVAIFILVNWKFASEKIERNYDAILGADE